MAEAVLHEDRGGGDRWAVGMMLMLAGSVQLWTGRTRAAIERLREAHALFEEINDDFGLVQSSGGARPGPRARPVRSRRGLRGRRWAALDGAAASPAGDHRWRPWPGLAATVQVGDVERSERDARRSSPPVRGRMTPATTRRRHRARHLAGGLPASSRATSAGAIAVLALDLASTGCSPRSTPTSNSGARARARAPPGRSTTRCAEADEVDAHDRASYLDRLTAGVARGPRARSRRATSPASTAAFDQVRAAADATEDRVSQALVRLADATAATARGDADAAPRRRRRSAAAPSSAWRGTGWRQAFALALGVPA